MSQPPDDNGPPQVFGPDGNDAGGAPPTNRDLGGEIRQIVYGLPDGDAIDIHHLSDEVRSGGGYVAEGVLKKEVERLVNDGVLAVVAAGNPMREHYRRPVAAADSALMRNICMELARLPDDRRPAETAMSAFQIANALTTRMGTAHEADAIEPALFALLKTGVFEAHNLKQRMPANDGSDAGETITITAYAFAPAVLFNALQPGLDALILPTSAPANNNAIVDAKVPGEADGAQRAAIAAAVAARVADAEKTAKREIQKRAQAEERAKAAEEALARAKIRLEEKGIRGVFDEAQQPEANAKDSKPDERGKAIRYEKRVPVTEALEAKFWREYRQMAGEIADEKLAIAGAKKSYEKFKDEAEERIKSTEAVLSDMREASKQGLYLLCVPEAYKVYDTKTGRTGVYEYASRRFVCWDDPASLAPGSQPGLPGLDAPIHGTVEGPKEEPTDENSKADKGEPPAAASEEKPKKDAEQKADEDAKAEQQAKADAVKASSQDAGPLGIAAIKPHVVALAKARPQGILWKDANGVTKLFLEAYAGQIGKPAAATAASTPLLLQGAVDSLIRGKTLSAVDHGEGWVLYHPENGEPGAEPKAPKPKRTRKKKDDAAPAPAPEPNGADGDDQDDGDEAA